MDVFEAYLDSRDQPADWRPVHLPPEERLVKFDAWLYRKLAERIDWTWAGDATAQGRRINQARNYVERMVLNLWRRGWLLDGSRLAKHILAPLQTIEEYQKKGQIKEFWPYFCATIDRYVGVNSEELQVEARHVGATMGQIVGLLGLNKPQNPTTLTELLARRAQEPTLRVSGQLRGKQRAYRAKERESTDQMPLW